MPLEQHTHEHIAAIAYWIKQNWYWIAGAFIGIFYSVRWSVLQYLRRHPTHSDMEQCKQDVDTALKHVLMEHEQVEFERQDKYEELNSQAHGFLRKTQIEHGEILKTLDEKISDLIKQVMENMRRGN